ncbi:non-hydrolyzing UDP-N-acetylglucosamine 2-epimerase [Halosimplex amylolyticum]|uniref:non-hydrolyzing UDP-N-acetylglucosamine 2-epimerase n=1 Tax=Halosimplex amylolyticum TaxID=3396616 RepID=UPI003F561024
MKVLSLVGARPQFVKAMPLSRVLRDRHNELVVHTGQHYDEELSDVFFEELDLSRPTEELGVGSGTHAEQTAAVVSRLAPVIEREDPDALVLYGDTNSTLGGAIVGSKCDLVVGHVEAGLRSGVRSMPEEVNRILTDHASDLLFPPTEQAVENLEHEGLGDITEWTGDVMYDAMQWAREVAERDIDIRAEYGLEPGEYVLTTVHRPRNTDNYDRLSAIVDALTAVDSQIVFPVHPRTEQTLKSFRLWDDVTSSLTVIDPVGYLEFVSLLSGARAVVTDSGGVQKEAFFLGRPSVTLREETEWTETVSTGWNVLVGADRDAIMDALTDVSPPTERPTPYGDGHAAERIVARLESAVTGKWPQP